MPGTRPSPYDNNNNKTTAQRGGKEKHKRSKHYGQGKKEGGLADPVGALGLKGCLLYTSDAADE